MTSLAIRHKQRGREFGDVTDTEQMKREVVVTALERTRRWQDDVCVASRLVDVDVNGRHEIEAGERAIQFASVWRREHRIAAMRDERLNLTFTFGENLFSQCGDRQFAGKLRQFAHATVPASEAAAGR